MPVPPPPFERLRKLTADLGHRLRRAHELRREIEPLRAGRLVRVDGEVELLQQLEDTLDDAFTLIASSPNGHDAAADAAPPGDGAAADDEAARDRDEMLDVLEALVEDVNWDVAEAVIPTLRTKREEQEELVKQAKLDMQSWEARLERATKVVDDAHNDGAPFSSLEADLLAARSSVASVRSALADRLYADLPGLRQNARAHIEKLDQSIKDKTAQVEKVRKLVKQADLLIMRVGASRDEYQYRVLLRSADRRQTRGINIIQDVRPLKKKDREFMVKQLMKLTTGVNDDLRSAHLRRLPAAPAMTAPEAAAPETTPPQTAAPQTTAPLADGVAADDTPRTISAADPARSVDAAVAQALATLGEFMFQMIIPERMQEYLKREPWSFSITTNDLELPWELISYEAAAPDETASEPRFLCLERSVSRMPLGEVFPSGPPRRASSPARKRRMLLIHSDPEDTLPAARREADTIEKELADRLEFVRVDPDRATNDDVNEILMRQSFDFIHYAGHALFDKRHPIESGLVLKDSVLTAYKIRRLNKGGSLVFLNACETGTVANEKAPQQVEYLLRNPEPVVGLASAFVYSGALGCIGSLWPVYDKPAAELAVRFYRYVLDGEPTGEALRLARGEIRVAYPREITWAAYVLYGDPTFRLTET